MKAKEEPRKACENCKYFSFLYYRAKYSYFVAVGEGYCGLTEYTEEEKAKLPFGFVCDKWEPKPCADTDLNEIKEELRDITAKLILIVKALSK